jgi:two-component system, cell cycle sensor histidine kinase and response regulator CckA
MNIRRAVGMAATAQYRDADTRRRGQNVLIIALGLIAIILALLVASFIRARFDSVPVLIGGIVILGAIGALSRWGWVEQAALLLVATPLLLILIAVAEAGQVQAAPFYCVISLLIAGVTLRPRGVGLAFCGALITLVGIAALSDGVVQRPIPDGSMLINAVFLTCFAALIAALGAGSATRALRNIQIYNQEARVAEQARHESEERYRLIAEHTSDLIALFDAEGRYLYASPSFRAILGYDPAELIGVEAIELVHPNERALVIAHGLRTANEGTERATFRMRHTDGSWRWCETFWTATIQQGVRYKIAVGRDITERKQLEAQLLQAQKMESIGRLAGGVAHDFNNLLTVIMGSAELALEALSPDDSACGDVRAIQKTAGRAANLTRQLLAFARKQIIEPDLLNLNDLLPDMDRLLRRLIGEDIALVTLPAPNLGIVKVDPGQIEQVLVNLAVNARDAMPNGGKLTIETRNMTLDDTYTRQHVGVSAGRYVMLAVSDTGSGMDISVRARIFEPFFTTKESGKGSGLGLATCYGIVQQHGGHIEVYSEIGIGTSFKIYLPRVEATPDELPRKIETDLIPRGVGTVLVVEDETWVRDLTTRLLRAQGYTVLNAADGEEALHVAEAYAGEIDLLLTDMVMPRFSGAVLAEQLAALRPRVKVVFMSGYTENVIIFHGQLYPRPAFLQKPFSPAALARKVHDALATLECGQEGER